MELPGSRIREDDGMSMMIGTGNLNKRRITIKNADGSAAGTITITKTGRKKKKRLQYNFKEISSRIMMSKTSESAGQTVSAARGKIAMLKMKLRSGEYDDKELQNAIIHAEKMERIARKRMRHLREEENAKQKGYCPIERDEELKSEISEYEWKKLMQEVKEFTEEIMDELEDLSELNELSEEFAGVVKEDDLEDLKKKHRADELREIVEADMKYLKALFDKLEKEKQEGSYGVSLQLEGVEMPVQVTEVPVLPEGRSVDVSV